MGKIFFFLKNLFILFSTGDYHFACPTVFVADIYAQENVPLYFYHFTLRSSTNPWHEWMGVLHGNHIFSLFCFLGVLKWSSRAVTLRVLPLIRRVLCF